MNKILLIFILVTIITSAYSQPDLKKVTEKNKKRSVVETYYVLKKDRKVKHGEYTRFVDGRKAISGQFNNNKEAGIWTFYDLYDSADLKYDYENDSVIFLDTTSYKTSDLDRPVIYLGSLGEARYIVASNLIYPPIAAEKGKSGRILVDIFVDKNGDVTDYKIQKGIYRALDKEAMRVVKMIPPNWLPAIKDGVPIESKHTFPVVFVLL